MTHALPLVFWSAILLVMAGSLFGVSMARVLWADDLHQARSIDEIRSRTEKSLREQVAILQEHIRILKNDH